MNIYHSTGEPGPIWDALDRDWFGAPLDPPVSFQFALAPAALSFRAKRGRPARSHPEAPAGSFQAGLWKYDVAEFFLTDPVTGHYLEFNLSPSGAHWCCEFNAPRQVVQEHRDPAITSRCHDEPGGWSASATLPLAWLRDHCHFGEESRLNACFILESPQQRFLTAGALPGPEPDFHQPAAFPRATFVPAS